MNKIKELKDRINNASRIMISTHVSPDGDAIGSSLGMYRYLKNQDKKVDVIVPNAFPNFLSWLPDSDAILHYDKNEEACDKITKDADLIISLDYNEPHRTAAFSNSLQRSNAYKVLIDHHIGEPTWPDLNLSVVGASSTCELVFGVLRSLEDGSEDFLDEGLAYCLYTGMLTDTGNFQFSSTTPEVHDVIASLMRAGVQAEVVNNHINNSFSIDRLKFFAYCLNKKTTFLADKKLAYTLVSSKELRQFNIQTGGTEGLVNEPMKVNDIEVSVLFKEDGEKVKLSFRSKGLIDVSKFAKAHFNGGGHRNAAGGVSFSTLKEAEQKFLANLAAL